MKPVLLVAAVLAVCAAAYADTPKDGAISVNPGRWNWKQETEVLGIPIREDNIECLIPEKATITLSKLARDLEEGCTVDNVVPIGAGYDFKLICKGKTKGSAKASLTHTNTTMSIRAKGSAKVLGIPAGFSMQADATYMGACTADELAHQREKYEAELAAEQSRGG
jgi:hypothetical protein